MAHQDHGLAYTMREYCLVQGLTKLESGERNRLSRRIVEKPELIAPPDLAVREKCLYYRCPHLGSRY
jgi:hypothetical protein